MKQWTFKSEQEPGSELTIEAMTYEGAYSKLAELVKIPSLWDLDEMLKID